MTASNCEAPVFASVTSTVYTLACDGRTGSTVSVSVGAGVFTNGAGTANVASSTFSVVSVTAPHATVTAADDVGTAISSSGDSSAAPGIVFTIALSEASADFVEADVTASNCEAPVFAALTSTVYTLACDGRTGSTVSVSVGGWRVHERCCRDGKRGEQHVLSGQCDSASCSVIGHRLLAASGSIGAEHVNTAHHFQVRTE